MHVLARNWWAVLIRGIAAIIFGCLAFYSPLATGFAIIILFGIYALVDGIFAIVAAIRAAEAHERWWPFVLEGIVGLVIAAITYFEPRVIGFALYFTIAVWAFLTGIFEIVAAIRLRKVISSEFWLILGGILSILFAVLLVVFPLAGVLTLIWLIGIYAIIFGIVLIGLSLRLRRHAAPAPTT